MKRLNIFGSSIASLLASSAAHMQLMRNIHAMRQIGPGESGVTSLHRDVEKSRQQSADRRAIGRWHPDHEISRVNAVIPGSYASDAGTAHAIRRMNRASRRAKRLGLDASSIPTHIKRNAQLAQAQA